MWISREEYERLLRLQDVLDEEFKRNSELRIEFQKLGDSMQFEQSSEKIPKEEIEQIKMIIMQPQFDSMRNYFLRQASLFDRDARRNPEDVARTKACFLLGDFLRTMISDIDLFKKAQEKPVEQDPYA